MNLNQSKIQSIIFWIAIFILILIEYLLFRSYVLREITPYYTTSFDQTSYLQNCYDYYLDVRKNGIKNFLTNDLSYLASSFVFCKQAVLFFLLTSASRLNALTINFIYFAVLQIILIKTACDLTHKRIFGLLLLGLLLSCETTFFYAGSLIDFRIDFMAMCLFGIYVSCALKSKVFLDKKWVFITTIVGAYLVLMRTITLAYILGSSLFLLAYLFFLLKKQPYDFIQKNKLKSQIKHLCFSTAGIAIFISPALWMQRHLIYNYYVTGHIISTEKNIRALQVGVTNFITNLIFYPKSLLQDHLGIYTSTLIAILLIGIFLIAKINQRKAIPHQAKQKIDSYFPITVCILSFIIAPIIILTSDLSKSPVVGGILVVPILWLVTWLTYVIYKKNENNRLLNAFLIGITIFIFTHGIHAYYKYTRKHHDPDRVASLSQISKMNEDIGNYMLQTKQKEIIYSSDQVIDFLAVQIVKILNFEKHNIMLQGGNTLLGGSIFNISSDVAIKELNRSNVYITNLDSYPFNPNDYPYNKDMLKLRPMLRQLADKKFVKLGDYKVNHYTMRVYIRRMYT